MATVTGRQDTSALVNNLARKSYAAAFMRLMPNGPAPIFGITANLKTKTALQTAHGYYSKMMVFPDATTNGGLLLAGSTTLTFTSTGTLIPGTVLQNFRTKEQILILTVPSGTTATVRRGVGSTAAAAILDTDYWPSVGNVSEEGSVRPLEVSITPTEVTNYTQIFRNSWALTDTLRATQTIAGEGNVAENRMDCMAFHAADIEKALIFGEKYSNTLNGRPLRKMDGIIASINAVASGNIGVAGSTTSYSQLETLLDPVFNYQSDPKMAMERVLFVGGNALKVINKIGRLSGQYQIVSGETSFGLQFSSFKLSRGTFKMIEHPLLNSNPSWSKMAIALDFSSLSLAYLADRKTKSEEYGPNGRGVESGADAVGGSLTTEVTLELMNPYANGVVYNLTDGAAG